MNGKHALTALLVTGLILGGCASPATVAPPSEPTSPPAAAPTQPAAPPTEMPSGPYSNANINWQQFAGTEIHLLMNKHPFTDSIEPALPEFEELTGITVVMDVLPEEAYWEKVRVLLAAGSDTPDAMMVGSLDISNAMRLGWLEPLTPYIENPALTDPDWYNFADFIKGPIDAASLNGQVYGLTINSDAQGMAFRKDLLEAKGLQPPQTFQELYEVAKAVNTPDISGTCIRGLRGFTITFQWTSFLLSNGGRFFDEDGKVAINSPEAVEATDIYAKIMRETGPTGVFQYGFPEVIAAYQAGKCAISLDTTGVIAAYLNPEKSAVSDKVGFAVHPHGEGKPTIPMYWVWYLNMNSQSKNKEATWLFLEWATSNEIARRSAPNGNTPGRASLWEDPEVLAAYGPEYVDAALAGLSAVQGDLVPYGEPKIFEMFDTIGVELQNIISEQKTAQQGMDDAAANVAEILGQ